MLTYIIIMLQCYPIYSAVLLECNSNHLHVLSRIQTRATLVNCPSRLEHQTIMINLWENANQKT